MTPTTGRILRSVGLLIEVLCILGLLSVARGRVEFWQKIGADPVFVLRLGLGFGIIVWATGTYFIVKGRRGPGK